MTAQTGKDWLAHLLEVRDQHAVDEKAKKDALAAAWEAKAGKQLSEALSYIGIDTGELTENAYRDGVFLFKLTPIYDDDYMDHNQEPRLLNHFSHGEVMGVPQNPKVEFKLHVTLADYVGASPKYAVYASASVDKDDDSWIPFKVALADRISSLVNFDPSEHHTEATESDAKPQTMAELADQLEDILGLKSEGTTEDVLAKAQATIDRLTAALHTIANAEYVDIPDDWDTDLMERDDDLLVYVKRLARQALQRSYRNE